jgi:hypothetical protein
MRHQAGLGERDDLLTLHQYHDRAYSVSPEEFAIRHRRSVERLRAKWEGVPIHYDAEWVKRVQEVCWPHEAKPKGGKE